MPPVKLHLKPGLLFAAKIVPYPTPFNVTVRGWKTGQYIVLDHPTEDNDNLARISPDAKCSVRFVNEGRVVSFSSQTLATLKRPLEIYLIEYPKTITNEISLKKYRPTKTAIPAAIMVEKRPAKGIIWDITYAGLKLSTNKDLALGQVVSLDFEFFTGQKFSDIKAGVRNRKIELRSIEFPYLYGCEFIDFPLEKKKLIQSFLEYCFEQWSRVRREEKRKSLGAQMEGQETIF